MARIDPTLLQLLESAEAAASADAVEAVCLLEGAVSLPPDQTERVAREVLERVAGQVGEAARRYKVFRNLGSFVVSASAGFVRELLKQPEIQSAVANRRQE